MAHAQRTKSDTAMEPAPAIEDLQSEEVTYDQTSDTP
jgi:hypothetical protein